MRMLHPGDTFPWLTPNIPGAQAIEVPGWLAGEFGAVQPRSVAPLLHRPAARVPAGR